MKKKKKKEVYDNQFWHWFSTPSKRFNANMKKETEVHLFVNQILTLLLYTYSNKAMCQLNEKLKSSQKYNFPLLQENISESSLKILGFKQKSIFKKSKIL